MTNFNTGTFEGYAKAYDRLQHRFAGKIEVVEPDTLYTYQDPNELTVARKETGFLDISAKAHELGPFLGRVVLYPSRKAAVYQPAVITRKNNSLQMTVLDQPFDPNVGITEGILFELGLKNDTRQSTFGAHTASRGFESGHFAPAMIGVKAQDAREAIITDGDKGTHSVGVTAGGVPEKMMQEGLLGGTAMKTREISVDTPYPIPLYWHPALEDDNGLMLARYTGPTSTVELMLGAASQALGEQATDQVGQLVDAAIRGR